MELGQWEIYIVKCNSTNCINVNAHPFLTLRVPVSSLLGEPLWAERTVRNHLITVRSTRTIMVTMDERF
jgi:hypothetical protein